MNKDKREPEYPTELESQLILRLPEEPAKVLREVLRAGENLKNRLTIQIDNDVRHGEVRFDHWLLHAKIVDLPAIVESLKTIDRKSFYKTADICQIMICKDEPDQTSLEEESQVKNKKKDPYKVEKKFLWPHGITPPTKNVRKRRFRKTLKKKCVEAPEIEKEVKRLLRADNEAVSFTWEVFKEEDEQSPKPEQSISTSVKPEKKIKHDKTMKKEQTLEPANPEPSNVVDIFGGAVSDSEDEDNINVEMEDSRFSTFDSRMSDNSSMQGFMNMQTRKDQLPIEFDSKMFQRAKTMPNQSHIENPDYPMPSGSKSGGLSSEEDGDYHSREDATKDNMSLRIEQLRTELEELKQRRQRTKNEIAEMENLALRQRFQEILHTLNQDIMYKEMEYQGLTKKGATLDFNTLQEQFEILLSFLNDKFQSFSEFANDNDRKKSVLLQDSPAMISTAQSIKIKNAKVKSRDQWHGEPPAHPLNKLDLPVSGVIVTHTATRACHSFSECQKFVRNIQKFHMESQGWDDVGYNFLVGGDGTIYEGRGFDYVGAHTKGHNNETIGVAFKGTFNIEKPTEAQFNALKSLISHGVENGKISKKYKLYPHSYFSNTKSPGSNVLKVIKKWPQFAKDKQALLSSRDRGHLNIVPRDDWLAQPPVKHSDKMSLPAKGVVVHHTETKSCTTRPQCVKEVRYLQMHHIETENYDDIGYNFLVGGDGLVYEGVGWKYVGKKGLDHKDNFAFALVGSFDDNIPTDDQMSALKRLIHQTVKNGKMRKDYALYPYSYFKKTTSPGREVLKEISRWPRFVGSKDSKYRSISDKYQIVKRDQWNASPALHPMVRFKHPVAEVYIHHIETNNCTELNECISFIRGLQKLHMANGSEDITFNFLIGGDGTIYEGRGWDFVGNHTRDHNHSSVSIAFIGNFDTDTNITPSTAQIDACRELLLNGVEQNKLGDKYNLQFLMG